MKPITPRVHGAIDYAACAAMLVAPHLLHLHPGARQLSSAFAASYLGMSALTDYPLGLRRLIPFPVHGEVELVSVPALLLVAAFQKGARERAYFLGLAGTVLTVYRLTDWQADPDA